MWGRFLAVCGLLFLVAACNTTPPPPHRYPMVEIPNARAADVALYVANSFRSIIAAEQTKPWDQRNRIHAIISADDTKVVIKSTNPDSFRQTGYLKLYIEPIQTGSAVVVGSKVNYVQNPNSSLEHETDIYTAAQVPSPEGFVMAYQQVFDIIAANFAASRRQAGSPQQAPEQSTRAFAMEWEGVEGPLAGSVTFLAGNSQIIVTLPKGMGKCQGWAENTPEGKWQLNCPDGLTAAGTYTGFGHGKGATGTGQDNRGRALKFNLGANDLPRNSDPATARSIDLQIKKNLQLQPVVDGRPRTISGAVTVTLQPDGTVMNITEADHPPNLDTDPDYKNLVQSYKDAIRAASPIAIARDKFSSWQTFNEKFSRHIDSDKDAIRAHIERFWTLPASVAKRTDNVFAYVEVSIDQNGNVSEAKETKRPAIAKGDLDYQSLLESCIKAVQSASPLPIPKDRYAEFRTFQMLFDPKVKKSASY